MQIRSYQTSSSSVAEIGRNSAKENKQVIRFLFRKIIYFFEKKFTFNVTFFSGKRLSFHPQSFLGEGTYSTAYEVEGTYNNKTMSCVILVSKRFFLKESMDDGNWVSRHVSQTTLCQDVKDLRNEHFQAALYQQKITEFLKDEGINSIPKIYDTAILPGEKEGLKGFTFCLIMEKLEPIKRISDASFEDFESFFRRLAEDLKRLHEMGIYHGDLHKGNIMLREQTRENTRSFEKKTIYQPIIIDWDKEFVLDVKTITHLPSLMKTQNLFSQFSFSFPKWFDEKNQALHNEINRETDEKRYDSLKEKLRDLRWQKDLYCFSFIALYCIFGGMKSFDKFSVEEDCSNFLFCSYNFIGDEFLLETVKEGLKGKVKRFGKEHVFS